MDAAIQEDAHGVAVSSYQGGHNEYFRYLVDLLRERGAGHIKVFGGGGGVIVPREIEALEAYGVTKIFSPEDGRTIGLLGIIDSMVEATDVPIEAVSRNGDGSWIAERDPATLGRLISMAETAAPDARMGDDLAKAIEAAAAENDAPVLGITGTGGAGKSSLTDELLRRLVADAPELPVAVLSIDPSKRKTGGALLGDRIRMNSIDHQNVYMRSLATRGSQSELSQATEDAIRILRAAGFGLIVLETSGIGQGSSAVADVSDLSLYVMTPEYGAASQLEKIDMLDFADVVAVNKFDRRGGQDALKEVRKQFRRNKDVSYEVTDPELPVFGTIASQFGDRGVDALYAHLMGLLHGMRPAFPEPGIEVDAEVRTGERRSLIPDNRGALPRRDRRADPLDA